METNSFHLEQMESTVKKATYFTGTGTGTTPVIASYYWVI